MRSASKIFRRTLVVGMIAACSSNSAPQAADEAVDVETVDVQTPEDSETSVDVPDTGDLATESCEGIGPTPYQGTSPQCPIMGEVCTWPAPGCEPGEKPDNVCTCNHGWQCEDHIRSCLPIVDVPNPEGTRPTPKHRPGAVNCEEPEPADDVVCTDSPSHFECSVDSDCAGPEGRCLRTYSFGRSTSCLCAAFECIADADCPNGGVCTCGSGNTHGTCGGVISVDRCANRCVPADCRIDADCGVGNFCSPSYEQCGKEIVGYHCHDPSVDECLSDAECGWNHLCSFVGGGWSCISRPSCD
ncbi:MAG: hypothetical protein ACI9OJ_003833 [Myxococcota bacterium]|jgi:hypothetical protein